MAFAGMDVGTSGCKLLVYDLDGNVIFKAVRHYAEEGGAGRRELNPELVLQKVKRSSQGDWRQLSGTVGSYGSCKSWRICRMPG